jgi:hypothetical protein
MKRVLYAVLILAMLAVPVSTAFADVPDAGDQPIPYPFGPNFLGELVLVLGGGFAPFERVDAFLYRPPTVDALGNPIWPLVTYPPPVGPNGVWWWPGPDSQQRRWSFAETEGTVFERADNTGFWFAVLMLPRDEVWYPCSFPLKWKCNIDLGPLGWIYHSPQRVVYDPAFGPLSFWPWLIFDPGADPADTVSPLVMDVMNYSVPRLGVSWQTVVDGYYWTPEDIP